MKVYERNLGDLKLKGRAEMYCSAEDTQQECSGVDEDQGLVWT